jgi:hypothetical protein
MIFTLTLTSIQTNLIEIWQSLLLAQAQLTQGNCHLTTPQTFTHQVASLVSVFFVPTSQGATFSGEEQLRRLYLGTQLWTVIKNVFTTAWLPSPAESILRSILKRPFDLSDVNVKGAWSKLCSDLVAAGIPSLLELFSIQDEREAGAEAKRQLWSVLAKSLQLSSDKSTWQDAVSFLDVSFGSVFIFSLLTIPLLKCCSQSLDNV